MIKIWKHAIPSMLLNSKYLEGTLLLPNTQNLACNLYLHSFLHGILVAVLCCVWREHSGTKFNPTKLVNFNILNVVCN